MSALKMMKHHLLLAMKMNSAKISVRKKELIAPSHTVTSACLYQHYIDIYFLLTLKLVGKGVNQPTCMSRTLVSTYKPTTGAAMDIQCKTFVVYFTNYHIF